MAYHVSAIYIAEKVYFTVYAITLSPFQSDLGAPLVKRPIRQSVTKDKRAHSSSKWPWIVATISTAHWVRLNGRLPIALLLIFFLTC